MQDHARHKQTKHGVRNTDSARLCQAQTIAISSSIAKLQAPHLTLSDDQNTEQTALSLHSNVRHSHAPAVCNVVRTLAKDVQDYVKHQNCYVKSSELNMQCRAQQHKQIHYASLLAVAICIEHLSLAFLKSAKKRKKTRWRLRFARVFPRFSWPRSLCNHPFSSSARPGGFCCLLILAKSRSHQKSKAMPSSKPERT